MFKVEIKDEAATAALMRLSRVFDDAAPVMGEIGEMLHESTRERYKQGIAPDGTKWAPKSPVTLARNPKWIRPLFAEGNMHETIFPNSGSDFVEIGVVAKQAAMMQFGGTKAQFPHLWGNIPARPFLGLSEQDEVNISDIISEHIALAMTGGK